MFTLAKHNNDDLTTTKPPLSADPQPPAHILVPQEEGKKGVHTHTHNKTATATTDSTATTNRTPRPTFTYLVA